MQHVSKMQPSKLRPVDLKKNAHFNIEMVYLKQEYVMFSTWREKRTSVEKLLRLECVTRKRTDSSPWICKWDPMALKLNLRVFTPTSIASDVFLSRNLGPFSFYLVIHTHMHITYNDKPVD